MISFRVLEQRKHRVAVQQAHGSRLRPCRVEYKQPAVRSHPRHSLPIYQYRLDASGRQLLSNVPYATGAGDHRSGEFPRRTTRHRDQSRSIRFQFSRRIRQPREARVIPFRPSFCGLNKQCAFSRSMDRLNGRRGKPLSRSIAMKLSLLQPKHAICGADPKPVALRRQATNIIARERRLITPIESLERKPIEAHQPSLGSQPKIAVGRLRNAVHAALRKSFFGRPCLLAQICKILSSSQREPAHQQQNAEQRPKRSARQRKQERLHPPSSMLLRSRFVHTLHILKVFLPKQAAGMPQRVLDLRQRKMFLQTRSSIEWLIPNLIFRAILGNADNPRLKVG